MSYLRMTKNWQGRLCYIYQIQPTPEAKARWPKFKKLFLVVSADPNNYGITLTDTKPQTAPPSTLSMIHRKHQKTGGIKGIFKHPSHRDYQIVFYGEAENRVLIEFKKPPEISFITKNQSLFRKTTKSTYTIKKTIDAQDLALENWKNVCAEMIDEYFNSLTDFETPAAKEDDLPPGNETTRISLAASQLSKKLRRRLKTLNKSLKKSKSLLTDETIITEIDKKSRLLQQYGYLLKEDEFELVLSTEQTGESATMHIQVDPEKSLGSNIESYFKDLKRTKKRQASAEKEISKTSRNIKAIEDTIKKITNNELDDLQLNRVADQFSIKLENQKINKNNTFGRPYRTYTSSEGFLIKVGKTATENDELTKSAHSNDIWIHIIQGSGSHVIIEKKSSKKPIGEKTIKEAAILAIHGSSFRNDCAGEVYIAEKKYLKKKKGLAPGLWIVEKSKNQFFRYNDDELKCILMSHKNENQKPFYG